MDPAILEIILTANPWVRDPGAFPAEARRHVPSPFLARNARGTEDWPVLGKAHLLLGARQSGRSSFLWHRFVERGTAPLHIPAEEPAVRAWCGRSPLMVLQDIRDLVGPETPVMIDEAQHLDEAGLLIKGLVDGGISNPLYVTGSSAFHLRAKTRESLAGRASRAEIHPLGLDELVPATDRPPALWQHEVREIAKRHMVVGGFPEAWLSDRPDRVLFSLVDGLLMRDASDLYRVQDLSAFRRLVALLATQAGSLVNLSAWAALCGVARPTVASWLEILEESRFILIAEPFVGGRRAELTHNPKLYVADNGILDAVARQFSRFDERTDRGRLLENWVAAEIRKRLAPLHPAGRLRFWRSKSGAEVDFVVEAPDGIVGLEAKASDLTRPELPRSARSFIEAYSPARFVVVNLSLRTEREVGATRVSWVGPEWFAQRDPFGASDGFPEAETKPGTNRRRGG